MQYRLSISSPLFQTLMRGDGFRRVPQVGFDDLRGVFVGGVDFCDLHVPVVDVALPFGQGVVVPCGFFDAPAHVVVDAGDAFGSLREFDRAVVGVVGDVPFACGCFDFGLVAVRVVLRSEASDAPYWLSGALA